MNIGSSSSYRQSSLLPRCVFLGALLAQLPLVASNWPLRPSALEVIVGVLLVVVGTVLNV
jgi:hypothetical protein